MACWNGTAQPLKLTMMFAPWNQMADVAQLIQSQWRDLGIDLELIRCRTSRRCAAASEEGNYNLIAFYDFGVDPSILNQFYLTRWRDNWSGFSDPELDNWLVEGTRQTDRRARAAAVRIGAAADYGAGGCAADPRICQSERRDGPIWTA